MSNLNITLHNQYTTLLDTFIMWIVDNGKYLEFCRLKWWWLLTVNIMNQTMMYIYLLRSLDVQYKYKGAAL